MERQRHRPAAELVSKAAPFFEWLRPNLDRLFVDEVAQKATSERLARIDPAVRWEAGPVDERSNFFAFSPNLDPELLPLTEALASVAPDVPGWTFLSAKPRKVDDQVDSDN